MKMIRKRLFTLLEVLIALSLTMLIMTTLLSSYLGAIRSALYWQQKQEELFQDQFFQHRLQEVFTSLIEKKKGNSFFFTIDNAGTPSLVFSYDNGLIFDYNLSGDVLGRLYLDPVGRLLLITWPKKDLWSESLPPPFHLEVLMTNVKAFSIDFFNVSKDPQSLPGIISIKLIKGDQKERRFFFPIPKEISHVTVPT